MQNGMEMNFKEEHVKEKNMRNIVKYILILVQ